MQFESAYKMLDDLEEMNMKPSSGIYNAIMAGYFREVIFAVYKYPFVLSLSYFQFP